MEMRLLWRIFAAIFETILNERICSPRQIYNADETGLFWKCLPSRTSVIKGKMYSPWAQVTEERVTIMCCANATGLHKLKLSQGESKETSLLQVN